MTLLSNIRLLITLDLALKGLPSSILAPINKGIDLMELDLIESGFDFSNPEIERQSKLLEDAIEMMNETSWKHSQDLNPPIDTLEKESE